MPKKSLKKNSGGNIQPIAVRGLRVHTFPKNINPKVKEPLELELVYNQVIQ